MGIEPVNYGSVFLFRNGFRIMPFGNTGDDSWGLDYRAQQGKNRYLGTRDLFGRVDVVTDRRVRIHIHWIVVISRHYRIWLIGSQCRNDYIGFR